MQRWKRGLIAAMALVALTGCDDNSSEDGGDKDKTVDIKTGEVSVACLRELPEPSVETGKASLSLSLENFVYSFEEDRNRFTHDRRFKESSGVGVYIYRGKVCVENESVCADACVRYRVEPGGSLTQRGHHFATPDDPDRISLQYWARDDAGNLMTIKTQIDTAGQNARVISP